MIVGDGDIASALLLLDKPDFIFFASGVSNSQEIRSSEFTREQELLVKQDRKKHLVYFSTLSVFYADSVYVRHKRFMENIVKSNFPLYTIVRLGNITWGDNPHTFINAYKIQPYPIKNEYRYIIDQEEFLYWVNLIPTWNCEMNITGQRMKIADILKQYASA